MPGNTETSKGKASKPVWYQSIRKYEKPDLRKAIWHLLNTFIPYFLILYLMYLTIQSGYSYPARTPPFMVVGFVIYR